MNYSDYNEIYDARNNYGEGFPVESDSNDINDLSEESGDLIESSSSSDKVAVYRNGDTITIVGDANGPWAIEV